MSKRQETKPVCGIYQIRNKVSGLTYIGQSSHIARRWASHRHNLRTQAARINRGDGPCKRYSRHLIYSWAKHGEDAFEFSILEECSPFELTNRELFWICTARANNVELANSEGPADNPMRGQKHTDETRRKMSVWASNFVRSEDHKKNIGLSNKGKTLSKETKMRISAAKSGKAVLKLRGDNNPSRRKGARDKFKGEGNPVHKPGVKEKIALGNSKQVIDINTLETWVSCTAAAQSLGVSVTAVSNAARGITKNCKGRNLTYVHLL